MSGKTLTNASGTWSEIKAGGGDKRRTVPPNGPLVVVGGGGSSGMEWDSAVLVVRGAGSGGEMGGEEDRRDLHVMQQGWLSH